MRGVPAADARQVEVAGHRPCGGPGEVEEVDGVVLEDGQGVEQGAGPGDALDLGQAQVFVRQQLRLSLLEAGEQLGDGVGRRPAGPYRQGVD